MFLQFHLGGLISTPNSPSVEVWYHLQKKSLRKAVYQNLQLLINSSSFLLYNSSSYPQSFHFIFQVKSYCTFFFIGLIHYFLPMKTLCKEFYAYMLYKIMKSRHCANIKTYWDKFPNWATFQILNLSVVDILQFLQ